MENGKLKVIYRRDGLVEEFHDGVLSFGNDNDLTPYFLRSCAKPLQASLIIDYGIDFSKDELAFCCGSHAGEDCHVKVAKKILNKLGLEEAALKCGIHPPLSRTMQDKMLINNEKPNQIHNNCSGKHLGFLAVCKKQGWDIDTYYLPNHPLQVAVKDKIYSLCEIKTEYPMTTDGCGVPIASAPLKNIVKGYKNLAEKYQEIIEAISENPYIYGGEDRLDTEIIQKSENLIAKVGAGGLCVVYNKETKECFALKMCDASTAARRIAVWETINRLGWAKMDYDNEIKTLNGKVVGHVEVVANAE